MSFSDIIDSVLRQRAPRTFYAPVPATNVLDEGPAAEPLAVQESYFELRLAEMQLANCRELFRTFVPFCVILADFHYGDARETIPYVVSNDQLRNAVQGLDDEYLELLNSTLTGRVPLMQDGVGLFTGLFRSKVGDLSETLFNVVGDIAKVADMTQLCAYLPIAKAVRSGIYRVLGMKDIEMRIGMGDELRVAGPTGRRLQAGYLAFVNADADSLKPEELWVKDGRLCVGSDRRSIRRLRDSDFCLIAVERHGTREHYNDLAFHAHWKDIQDMIWDGHADRAEAFGIPTLGKAIVASPDLIPEDKRAALLAYRANFEAELKRWQEYTRKPMPVVRGARGGGTIAGKAGLRRAEVLAGRSYDTRPVAESFKAVADHYEAIPALADGGQRVDIDPFFDQQMAAVRKVLKGQSADPETMLAAFLDEIVEG